LSSFYFISGFFTFLGFSLSHLLSVSEQLRLKSLLLINLFPLLFFLPALLLLDLVLKDPLQILLLMLLPFIYMLRNLHEAVHRAGYGRPGVLEGLFEGGIKARVTLAKDRDGRRLIH
jgi:positive regulator of sigma E activity